MSNTRQRRAVRDVIAAFDGLAEALNATGLVHEPEGQRIISGVSDALTAARDLRERWERERTFGQGGNAA